MVHPAIPWRGSVRPTGVARMESWGWNYEYKACDGPHSSLGRVRGTGGEVLFLQLQFIDPSDDSVGPSVCPSTRLSKVSTRPVSRDSRINKDATL